MQLVGRKCDHKIMWGEKDLGSLSLCCGVFFCQLVNLITFFCGLNTFYNMASATAL